VPAESSKGCACFERGQYGEGAPHQTMAVGDGLRLACSDRTRGNLLVHLQTSTGQRKMARWWPKGSDDCSAGAGRCDVCKTLLWSASAFADATGSFLNALRDWQLLSQACNIA